MLLAQTGANTATIKNVDPCHPLGNEIKIHGGSGILQSQTHTINDPSHIESKFTVHESICWGDLGAPAVVQQDGKAVLFAIANDILPALTGDVRDTETITYTNVCKNAGQFTLINTLLPWLKEADVEIEEKTNIIEPPTKSSEEIILSYPIGCPPNPPNTYQCRQQSGCPLYQKPGGMIALKFAYQSILLVEHHGCHETTNDIWFQVRYNNRPYWLKAGQYFLRQALEKVIAFVINDNKGRKVFDFNTPNSLHT